MNQKLKKGLKYAGVALAYSPMLLGIGLGLKFGNDVFNNSGSSSGAPECLERVVENDETRQLANLDSSLIDADENYRAMAGAILAVGCFFGAVMYGGAVTKLAFSRLDDVHDQFPDV